MKIYKYFSFLLGLPKTIYFNFKYFPLKIAIKLPVIISYKVLLLSMNGKVSIVDNITFGMIRLGFGSIPIFDGYKNRSIWRNDGNIIFKGQAHLGQGFKVNVCHNSTLELGKNLMITANSTIICEKGIKIGNNCLISWEVLIMDTDEHIIKNKFGEITNNPRKITIGNKVWIGCRCTILKGTKIGNNCVIGANSLVNSDLNNNNQLIGGNPAKTLKEKILWQDN